MFPQSRCQIGELTMYANASRVIPTNFDEIVVGGFSDMNTSIFSGFYMLEEKSLFSFGPHEKNLTIYQFKKFFYQ